MDLMTVYAAHCAMTMRGGKLVPKFDLSPRTDLGRQLETFYGPLVWVFEPNDAPWTPGIVDKGREALKGFDPDNDAIILIGNPFLLSLVAILAADRGDNLKFLQYSGGKYVELKLSL